VPTQEYECQTDGAFDIHLSFKEDVPSSVKCPDCGVPSRHVLHPPAALFARTWNEQANDYQRDPYTQAKAQATNMYHEQKDMGIRVDKPTEEGLQRAAAQIANPPPPLNRAAESFRLTKKLKETRDQHGD
jgi:hypothetical protein